MIAPMLLERCRKSVATAMALASEALTAFLVQMSGAACP